MRTRRLLATLAIAAAGAAVLIPAASAAAAPTTGHGETVSPAQPYLNNPDASDWVGSYVVGGVQSWPIRFASLAPDANEAGAPGTLTTKWGTAVDPAATAELAYLVYAYADTTSDSDAAAIGYLAALWTSGPQNPGQLDPSNDFRHIAYDAPFHLSRLTSATQARVSAMQAEAAHLAGTWTASVAAPATATIGAPSDWTVNVLAPDGVTGVGGRIVTLTAVDGTFAGGVTTTTITTPPDGSAATVALTPTGTAPAITATTTGPAPAPAVFQPVAVDVTPLVQAASVPVTARATVTATGVPTAPPVAPALAETGVTVPLLVPIVASGLAIAGAIIVIVVGLRRRRSA